MTEHSELTELSGNLKQYIKTTIEIIKLEILQRTIVISSYILVRMMSFIISLLALIFLSISVGFLLAEYFKSYAIGFALVAGIFGLLAVLVSFVNQRKIEKRLQNNIIRHLFSDQQIIPIVAPKTTDYE